MSDQDDDGEQRRDERLEAEAQAADEAARRHRLLQLSVGGVFLAIIIVVVVIIVAGSGGGSAKGGEGSKLSDVAPAEQLLKGTRQTDTVLGNPGAPVKIFEYGDLQCPFCKANAEEITPPIIENAV